MDLSFEDWYKEFSLPVEYVQYNKQEVETSQQLSSMEESRKLWAAKEANFVELRHKRALDKFWEELNG